MLRKEKIVELAKRLHKELQSYDDLSPLELYTRPVCQSSGKTKRIDISGINNVRVVDANSSLLNIKKVMENNDFINILMCVENVVISGFNKELNVSFSMRYTCDHWNGFVPDWNGYILIYNNSYKRR